MRGTREACRGDLRGADPSLPHPIGVERLGLGLSGPLGQAFFPCLAPIAVFASGVLSGAGSDFDSWYRSGLT